MGANLDKFRRKEISPDTFLVNALWLSLDKPVLSPEQKLEWESEALKIKGDPEEIASAVDWALRVHVEWPKYIRRMKNVADNLDKILRDYRAEMRAKRNADRAANGEERSGSCQALMDLHPGKTRPQIEDLETQRRVDAATVPFKKACKTCKGKPSILSKEKRTKGVPVHCPVCDAFRRSIWPGIQKEVLNELYA